MEGRSGRGARSAQSGSRDASGPGRGGAGPGSGGGGERPEVVAGDLLPRGAAAAAAAAGAALELPTSELDLRATEHAPPGRAGSLRVFRLPRGRREAPGRAAVRPQGCRGEVTGSGKSPPGPSGSGGVGAGWGQGQRGCSGPRVGPRRIPPLSCGPRAFFSERGVYVCTLLPNTKIRAAQSIVNRLDKR